MSSLWVGVVLNFFGKGRSPSLRVYRLEKVLEEILYILGKYRPSRSRLPGGPQDQSSDYLAIYFIVEFDV